jgi:hypothetical protein
MSSGHALFPHRPGAFQALLVSAAYLALEPYVRRRWPWRVVAWNRALAGRWRDPLVGRDVLVGLTASVAFVAALKVLSCTRAALEFTPGWPATTFYPLITAGPATGLPLIMAGTAGPALAFFFIFFLLYLLTRREWLAILVYAGIVFIPVVLDGSRWVDFFVNGLATTIFLTVMLRYGLLAFCVLGFANRDQFRAHGRLECLVRGRQPRLSGRIVGLAVYGFVVSGGGRWLAWVGHLTGEAREQAEPEAS